MKKVVTDEIQKTLLNLPRFIKQSLVISCDFIICALSVWLAFGLRLDDWGGFQSGQLMVFLVAVGFSFPLFIYFGLYRAIFRYIGSVAFLSIVHVFIFYSFLFFCTFTVIGVKDVPRSIGVLQPILWFIGVGISRSFIRYWLDIAKNVRRAFCQFQSVVLIYGAGSVGRQLAFGLSGNKEILIKGFVDDNPQLCGRTINGIPVYSGQNLPDIVSRLNITDILLAIPPASQHRRRQIISLLNKSGVRVRSLPKLIDLATGISKLSNTESLDMNDLLEREVILPELGLLEKNIRNQVIVVTGAGGSIGSELCRQIIKFVPKSLILIDSSEYSLYLIYEELKGVSTVLEDGCLAKVSQEPASSPHQCPPVLLVPCLASVRDRDVLSKIFRLHQPATVFHAAAYKHVSLVEKNPAEGICNNVFGTYTCAQVSLEVGVRNFILVSTDKAVRPTNVMGASKRIAELVLQAMTDISIKSDRPTNFSMVRFGNVLGSSGSVVQVFSKQIAKGGPITLSHPEVTRYFMTITEAAQLVIQAGAMAVGGDVFVLNMGAPVRIYDLAVRMIYLSGLLVKDEAHPHGDIEIKVTGLQPGEKLYEELLIGDNPQPTSHPKIMKAHEEFLSWNDLQPELDKLLLALNASDDKLVSLILKKLVPGYSPNSDGASIQ